PPLVRVWRTLLLGPAFFRCDDAEAFAALCEQVEQIEEELGRTFGWTLELNRDYARIVRDQGGAGPVFNLNGAHDQIILLLCSSFRQQVEQGNWQADPYGCLYVPHWEVLQLFSTLRQN